MMRLITVLMPKELLDGLHVLAQNGKIGSRSDGIRLAVNIKLLLERAKWPEIT